MKKLKTIQKRNNLNVVFVVDDPHPINNGHHRYAIEGREKKTFINFQNGARLEEGSIEGVLDVDLLEIVRHRLESFQKGKFACKENEIAIQKIEEALLWMNKRVEERAESGILGKNITAKEE